MLYSYDAHLRTEYDLCKSQHVSGHVEEKTYIHSYRWGFICEIY